MLAGNIGFLRMLLSLFSASAVMRAVSPFAAEGPGEEPTADDANRTFRTRLVLAWLGVNAILIVAISRLPAQDRTIYFQVILWM